MEISAVKGGGGLMANAIKNFYIFWGLFPNVMCAEKSIAWTMISAIAKTFSKIVNVQKQII